MTIISKQFGFTNVAGAIANLADGDQASFYQPAATDFAAYTAQFFGEDKVTLNTAGSFPALEFDLGAETRVPNFLLKVESELSLGPGIMIGSNVGATSVADTLQVGDILLGEFTAAQLVGNRFLDLPTMRDNDIRKRFLRLLQRSTDPAVIAPTPGPLNSVTYDTGSGSWEVVDYATRLVIEAWGAAASGGVTSQANNGGNTTVSRSPHFSLTAGGGVKASASVANSGSGAGTGGSASGGNTLNVTGGAGGVPAPTSSAGGNSGKGGDAPFGGLGGDAITFFLLVPGVGGNFKYGNPGNAPGGGGSGRNWWYPSGDVIFQKLPGGGSGGYVRHEIELGAGIAEPGDLIAFAVGTGGVSTGGDGRGANGRVRFSWT